MTLTRLTLPPQAEAGAYYEMTLEYDAVGNPQPEQVCFFWNDAGPYCWDDLRVDRDSQTVRASAKTDTPSTYLLTGYVTYRNGLVREESNKVSASLVVY